MDANKPQDRAALLLVIIIGVFVLGSLVALIVGSFLGLQGGENIWAGLFSLCTAILGAIGGWIGGTQAERSRRDGNGHPPAGDQTV